MATMVNQQVPRAREVNQDGLSSAEVDNLSADTENKARNSLFDKEQYNFSQAFAHPTFTEAQMKQVTIESHIPQNRTDRVAKSVLNLVRKSFDLATGYKHPPKGMEDDPKFIMSRDQWLRRFVFLESVAGVPGMVGGMVRHLHSIRLLKRDRAWIETLLEEGYNERMHLLSFIKLSNPGFLMRAMILGAQGVFFNAFFLTYLLFPRVCHRFVGYLEEEAVTTYTRCIEDLEQGRLPEFAETPAPDIALQYWNMKPGSTVKDLIYYVRADESKHREVNHTLGNLNQNIDPNPYALKYTNLPKGAPRPTKDLEFSKNHGAGWDRKEIHL